MPKNKNSVVVLFSGGLDSCVCLWHLKQAGADVHALSILSKASGENHHEVMAATRLARRLGVPHSVVDISSLGSLFGGRKDIVFGLGGQIGQCIPPTKQGAPMTVAMMHVMAMMYASTKGIRRVAWALHKDDLGGESPDRILGYARILQDLAKAQSETCEVIMPFLNMSKADIIRMGRRIGAPIEETVSCIMQAESGQDHACGSCKQCLNRIHAFEEADGVSMGAAA